MNVKGYGRNARRRTSLREQLERNRLAESFYAAAADKPPPLREPLPPKRERKRPRLVTASEHQEQSAVISWWWLAHQKHGLPVFALYAVPNGGARDAITGSRLKDEGVRRGALDLNLAKPIGKYAGLFLEMKVGVNKPSPDQLAFIDYLESVGYKCAVCWSATAAIHAIEEYLANA